MKYIMADALAQDSLKGLAHVCGVSHALAGSVSRNAAATAAAPIVIRVRQTPSHCLPSSYVRFGPVRILVYSALPVPFSKESGSQGKNDEGGPEVDHSLRPPPPDKGRYFSSC